MAYTVSDVQSLYAGSIRLIAGMGGLARPVREVGILDYELLPEVKSRFQRVNFYEGQLVLSTFLYAKDDPFLITEAIKFLVSKGSSGLVIKNVFHLQIPDGALRYANARSFPLFVTTSDSFLFDEVITSVDRMLRQIASADAVQHELDQLLADEADEALCNQHARALNPSLRNEHLAIYVPLSQGLDSEQASTERHFAALQERFATTELSTYTNLLARYDDGILLVASGERMVGDGSRRAAERLANLLRADVLEHESAAAVGISDTHYERHELAASVREALCAARFASRCGGGLVHYGSLGSYRLILAHLDSPALRAFAHRTLEPLRVYDAENNGHLMETLTAYCESGQSFAQTAGALGQHENTVRRRLERVARETGLSYRVADEMEQLSLAHKIEVCRTVMS